MISKYSLNEANELEESVKEYINKHVEDPNIREKIFNKIDDLKMKLEDAKKLMADFMTNIFGGKDEL